MSMVDPKVFYQGADKFCDCEVEYRICASCGHELPIDNDKQSGYYCCDEYYCSLDCVNWSCALAGTTWTRHYQIDGDCYWTEWEI